MKANNGRKGFTLVEMLVVMSLIAILSTALLMGYGRVTRTAQKAKAQETVANVATALGVLLQQKSSWPKKLLSYQGADGTGKGCVVEVAKVFAENGNLLGVTVDSSGKPTGTDRCGIVDPWAVAVLKRSSANGESTAVPSGGTVRDHVIYFALDTDFDGITEAKVCGETVKIRANAIAWSAGADGELGDSYSKRSKKNADNIYSWQRKQEEK